MKLLSERFEEGYCPEPNTGCWLWTKKTIKGGYGRLYANGRYQLTHRISWQVNRGEIPDGMWVLHKCDTPACVNPDHLFLGTHRDNVDDKCSKGRQFTGCFGENHPLARLTAEQVDEIKARLERGERNAHIARDYPVKLALISKIKTGRAWKDR